MFDAIGAPGAMVLSASRAWLKYAGEAGWHLRVERIQFVVELLGKDSRGMADRQYRQVQHHDMTRIPAGTMDFS